MPTENGRGDRPLLPVGVREIVAEMVELQRLRKFAIDGQKWCNARTDALIVEHLVSYDLTATPAEEDTRRSLFKRAAAIRVAIEKTGKAPRDVGLDNYFYVADYTKAILASARSRQTWDEVKIDSQKALERSAQALPVYPWIKTPGLKGFGDRGLAIVVAEAAGFDEAPPEGSGQLRRRLIGEYRTVSGLWKRMGLAVIDGQRQKSLAFTRKTEEERRKYFYDPQRRAECWVLADSLLRAQLVSELRACKEAIEADPAALRACLARGIEIKAAKKVEVLRPIIQEFGLTAEQHATGPYGEVYLRRRAHTAPRVALTADLPDKVGDFANPLKWTPGRCYFDASRVMFKILLRDLRREWRRRS